MDGYAARADLPSNPSHASWSDAAETKRQLAEGSIFPALEPAGPAPRPREQ
jgi:hypothetical protein